MKNKISHLLSPVKIGDFLLKNRLVSSNSLPHFLQGPETYPSEQVINHVVNCAKNGAAIVTFGDWTNMNQRTSFNKDGQRYPMYMLDTDPSVENYFCQMADQVHYYSSRISFALMPFTAPDPAYDVCDEPAVDLSAMRSNSPGVSTGVDFNLGTLFRRGLASTQLSCDQIHEIIEMQAQRVRRYQSMGFDMCTLHFAYRATLFSRFLSPRTNHRTDGYGGSLENRARFLLELCSRIRSVCGKTFPIEIQINASEEGGTTLSETITLSKMAQGLVDIFQFRAKTADLSHPTPYNSVLHQYPTLKDCAAVKAGGTSILCEPIGGFQDPYDMEEIIASGKADLIGSARLFIADFDYYRKIKDGRGADVVPCIRCNKCHVPSLKGEWLSICSVNPEMGIAHKLDKLIRPVTHKKRVAVIGGGPAGMRAAIYCDERGHEVTLFEASNRLGGQLKLMDAPTFKWPLVNFREYLIKQLAKSQVSVKLNTRATREMLAKEEYDAVIIAIGAQPKVPPIPGAERCWNIFTVFGHEKELGYRCVVIGGSESGTEAGIYLAENGHDTTVLTRRRRLAPDATPIHYRETMEGYIAACPLFHSVLHATATEVGNGYVAYTDKNGQTRRIECDSVVALGGMAPLHDEAIALYGLAAETFVIGDCYEVGNLFKCNRGAYSASHQI